MDAKKITEDYHDWHNIAELRLLGLSRSQIAKKLQLPPGRVMRLSRLNVDELLQHGNRPRPSYSCRLDPYEESVKHLLITCPYYSSTQIHEYLKENNPSFPKVCEKTVFNYVPTDTPVRFWPVLPLSSPPSEWNVWDGLVFRPAESRQFQ